MTLAALPKKVHTTRQSETINLEVYARLFDSITAVKIPGSFDMIRCRAAYQPTTEGMEFCLLRKLVSRLGNLA